MSNDPKKEAWFLPGNVLEEGKKLAEKYTQSILNQADGGAQEVVEKSIFATKMVADHISMAATLALDPAKSTMDAFDTLKTGVQAGKEKLISNLIVNSLAKSTSPRPRPYSLWPGLPDLPAEPGKPRVPRTVPGGAGYVSDYTSWPSLTRRDYSGRHMKPADPSYTLSLPKDDPPTDTAVGQVTALFRRPSTGMKTGRSSVLFMFFAQWFTDSFLRFDKDDRRKNTSNHEIDLCQIYGLHEDTTTALRAVDEEGKVLPTLACRLINGEEYPDLIYEKKADGTEGIKDRYKGLSCVTEKERLFSKFSDRFNRFYATGLEQGNSSIGYVAISTIFLREHNRIVRILQKNNPEWDSERLFQTARNINIVILIKLVTEDYITHITNNNLIKLNSGFSERESWYRTNWISVEFDLLYRWHSLIPETIKINDSIEGPRNYLCNTELFEAVGLVKLISEISNQKAGAICLENSPSYMMEAEYTAIKMGRNVRLQSYNAYRQNFGLPPIKSFEDLTDNVPLRDKLKSLYDGDIDKLEFIVGLYAEKSNGGRLFGNLMTTMVGYDAVTHIYTNPLLSENIYNADTFTQAGLDIIRTTNSLENLVKRNVPENQQASVVAKFGA